MTWDKLASLNPFVISVACQKVTEPPFSGCYLQAPTVGTYLCRRCGLPLWENSSQFSSHCGWPSFDDRLKNTIIEQPDEDGHRVEIICQRCNSHLGHVFHGEGYTQKNQRDCVNSVMLDFVPFQKIYDTREIIIAGGCFWGVEHLMHMVPGVLFTECGYIGGHQDNPSYDNVCSGSTGHFEAVRVIYDNALTSSKILYELFFEIHNPTQNFGQGPDIGPQYRSAIFHYDDIQKQEAEQLILELEKLGFSICTQLLPVSCFWKAESYHQLYYEKNHKAPYCHTRVKRFNR